MRRVLLALLLLPAFALAIPADAQSFESIENFDSQIYISKQNVAEIAETIQYNFGTTQRHGIYRDIPIDYVDNNGQIFKIVAELNDITDQNGNKVKSETNTEGGNFRIKIGDPDKTVTGMQTYRISYKLWPIVTQKGSKGFLNLDITGNGWQVPIHHAAAIIRFDGIAVDKMVCFTGAQGSKTRDCTITSNTIKASGLRAGEGLTVNADLPAGYVEKYLEPGQSRPMTKGDYIGLAIVGAIFGVGLLVALVFLLRYLRERHRKKSQTIIPEYEPPKDLSVAEIGHLQDDVSNTREVTAMLVDMAVKGYIKIEQTKPKKLFAKAKYALHKLKESAGLSSEEAQLLNAIFVNATDGKVEVDKLDRSKMATTTAAIYSSTKKSLKAKGFYGSFKSEPNIIEKMLDTGNISDEGAKMWAKIEGFKLYLSVVEKDRLKFSDAPEKTPELFSKMLPYAIALGVEKEWAKQFEGIDISQNTNWYVGSYAAFSAANLTRDLNSSFAPVVSSNSSVSSSGGSSGGGFGGGGGGSW